jgi:hypothetical protein
MSQTPNTVIGIDIGKNSFHVVGHDACGAIVLRQKWSRGQVEARLADISPCLIGMEACVGAPEPQTCIARAAVPERANAVARTIVVSFMIVSHASFSLARAKRGWDGEPDQ